MVDITKLQPLYDLRSRLIDQLDMILALEGKASVSSKDIVERIIEINNSIVEIINDKQ